MMRKNKNSYGLFLWCFISNTNPNHLDLIRKSDLTGRCQGASQVPYFCLIDFIDEIKWGHRGFYLKIFLDKNIFSGDLCLDKKLERKIGSYSNASRQKIFSKLRKEKFSYRCFLIILLISNGKNTKCGNIGEDLINIM